MNIETLKKELELNFKVLQNTDDLKAWTDLMIQRVNLSTMLVDRLEALQHYAKVG